MKLCTKCGGDGPFYRNKRQPDGLSNWCKTCHNAYSNQSESGKANKRAWKASKATPRVCKDCGAPVGKGQSLCDAHREVSQKRWEAQNKVLLAGMQKAWRDANPERHRLNKRIGQQRRKARIKALAASFTTADWKVVLEVYNGKCAYCGGAHDKLQQDHVMPVVQGGGYTKDNIVPACPKCNLEKHDRTPEQWVSRWYERTSL